MVRQIKIISIIFIFLLIGLSSVSANIFNKEMNSEEKELKISINYVIAKTDDGEIQTLTKEFYHRSNYKGHYKEDSETPFQEGFPIYMGKGWHGGSFASPKYADLDGDNDLEIIQGGSDGYVYVWHHNGTIMQGWPFKTGSYVYRSVCIGDIDKDGNLNVIIISNDGKLYVTDNKGQLLDGWPIKVDRGWSDNYGPTGTSGVCIADIDGDSFLDIIYNSLIRAKTYIYNYMGELLPGWPQDHWDEEENDDELCASTSAVADLDGDGSLEIITGTTDEWFEEKYYNKIYVWHSDGTSMKGWPKKLRFDLPSYPCAPIIGDLNMDGNLDIVVADKGAVYALDKNGNMLEGFPYITDDDPYLMPPYDKHVSFGNFDDDPNPEIVATKESSLLIIDDNGERFEKFPKKGGSTWSCPIISDVDFDGKSELIVHGLSFSDSVKGFNEDGSVVDGFPLQMYNCGLASPLVLDLDGDGDIEVCIIDYDGTETPGGIKCYFYVWDLPHLINYESRDWHTIQHNLHNNGYYNYDISSDFMISAGGPYKVKVKSNFNFTGSAYYGKPPYTWEWDIDDDGTIDSTDRKFEYCYQKNGEFIIKLKVIDSENNIKIDFAEITVNPRQRIYNRNYYLFSEIINDKLLLFLKKLQLNDYPSILENL